MEQKRKRIVAGNWKMHKSYEEGRDLALQIVDKLPSTTTQVVLATPYIHLKSIGHMINGISNLFLAAQNCHQEVSGAYTGEVSAAMLRSVGVQYVILGHSERRAYFHETDALLAQKIDQVLAHAMHPIFCCGESLEMREGGKHLTFVEEQLEKSLFHLSPDQFERVVIAYEPIWAIGTGQTASPEQAQEMHAHIRNLLRKPFGSLAERTAILYGGSVKPDNAREIFSQPDVDGGLIGGASLKAEDFIAIVDSF